MYCARSALAIFAVIVLQGCSTYAGDRYAISADNVELIRQSMSGRKISVGDFSAAKPGQTEVDCRLVGPIKTPDGQSFEAYIRKALIDELRIADAYSDDADLSLSGNLKELDFGSASGYWKFVLEVSPSRGDAYTVTETYNYDTSFTGETACNEGAQALMPAVQDLIKRVLSDPAFQKTVAL